MRTPTTLALLLAVLSGPPTLAPALADDAALAQAQAAAVAAAEAGDFARAAALLEAATAAHRGPPTQALFDAKLNLATAYRRLGRDAEAARVLREVIDARPATP